MKQDRNGVRTAQDLERKYDFSSIDTLKRNYELQKTSLNKVENELNNFVEATTQNIEDLQNQVDGNITTWFSSGIPTLNNYPANEWTDNDTKNNHLGDLYYDKNTGYGYRFTLEENTYKWIEIKDTDVTQALALANAAQDTADSKRRVFVVQPTPPYDVGDLWLNNEELYRCQITKGESETYASRDWIKATKYTDDTVANQVGNNLTILSGTVTEIRDDVDELSTTMTNTTTLVNEQGETIGTLQEQQSSTSQTVTEISATVASHGHAIDNLEDTVEEHESQLTPTDTSSGSSIYLEDSAETELIDFELEGKTTQETRSGINKLKMSTKASTTTNGLTYRVSDEVFYINGTSTAGSNLETIDFEDFTLSAGTYYFYLLRKGTSRVDISMRGVNGTVVNATNFGNVFQNTLTNRQFTLTEETTFTRFTFYVPNGVTFNNDEFRIMVCNASHTATEYEQYGVMPSPDYPSELVSVGYENLLPSDLETTTFYGVTIAKNSNGTYTLNGTATADISLAINNNFIPLSGTWRMQGCPSGGSSSTYMLSAYVGYWGGGSPNIDTGNGTNITYTGNVKVRFYIKSGTTCNNLLFKPMLTKDTQAHSYIPYGKYGIEVKTTDEDNNSNIYLYTLDNPLRAIGNYKDLLYIKNGMLYVDRKIGKVVLDGTQEVYLNGTTTNNNNFHIFINNGKSILNSSTETWVSSNYFLGSPTNQAVSQDIANLVALIANSRIFFTCKKTDFANADAFKAWLSTHNTEVQYVLEEPYIEELGSVDMPSTYKGITYLNTTDELEPNMDITYVRDTIIANYVESHVSELKINEQSIESRVQTIEESDYGTRINAVEERTTDTEKNIEVISTNIDTTTGEVREVTTTTGFKFNAEGMTIEDSNSNFKALHRNDGTYYKEGNNIVGQYTKDGSKQKDLDLFGIYTYGKNDINDTPMFLAQLFTDSNGEECFGHFYNRGD